jgi:hypothetical protein
MMSVASKGSHCVSSRRSRLSDAAVVLVLMVVVPIVGAKGGRVGRQGLRGSGADWRSSQVTVGWLALVSVESSVVRRGLRRRVHGSAVVNRVGGIGSAHWDTPEMTSHPGSLDGWEGHVRILIVDLKIKKADNKVANISIIETRIKFKENLNQYS